MDRTSWAGAPGLADRRYRIAVVGLGAQGKGIAALASRHGHTLVGAADIGALVGQKVAALVPGYRGDVTVSGSIEEMLASAGERPDIVVIAASVDLAATLDMAGRMLDDGINVVTLNPEGFGLDPAWADPIHARAVAGGASLLNTGVQDLWWVHLLTLVAASAVDLKRVMLIETISLEVLSPAIGAKIGISLSPEDFAAHVAATAEKPSVIGGPLVEAARRMGARAGPMTKTVTPIFTDAPYEWISAGITLPTDRTQGMEERIVFETDRGFTVEGVVAVVPAAEESTRNEIRVEGLPDLIVQFGSLSREVTDIALIARIPDVVNAAPGVLFSADLPPPRHHFRR